KSICSPVHTESNPKVSIAARWSISVPRMLTPNWMSAIDTAPFFHIGESSQAAEEQHRPRGFCDTPSRLERYREFVDPLRLGKWREMEHGVTPLIHRENAGRDGLAAGNSPELIDAVARGLRKTRCQ